jgi:hypothetical protein
MLALAAVVISQSPALPASRAGVDCDEYRRYAPMIKPGEYRAGRLPLAALMWAALMTEMLHPCLKRSILRAQSDGEPGETGQESYIYEDCKRPSDTCMKGHVWNYGADTCIKYEVDRGVHSPYTGTYYVKCHAVNCCTAGHHESPDVKKWDIGQAGPLFGDKISYLGKTTTMELNNKTVTADAWNEIFDLPFTKIKVNYTYYVTVIGNDTITHRIEYSAPGEPKVQAGAILCARSPHRQTLQCRRDATADARRATPGRHWSSAAREAAWRLIDGAIVRAFVGRRRRRLPAAARPRHLPRRLQGAR